MGDILVPLALSVASNPGRYGHDGTARLVNVFVEPGGVEGKTQAPLLGVDGLASFASMSSANGGSRGMIEVDGALYVVAGRQLFKVDAGGNETLLGGVGGDGRVTMARNAKPNSPEIAIVAGGLRFIVENDVLSSISDADLPPPLTVGYLNGRFIWPTADGSFWWSEIEDGANIGAANFATAEADPDGLTGGLIHNLEVWLFGSRTVEIWVNTADADAPFQRLGGAVIQIGCGATHSIRSLDSSVVWVDDGGRVVMATGYQPQVISDRGVALSIEAESDLQNLEADVWTDGRHKFYALSGTNFTWVYDANTGQWHERESYNSSRWRGAGTARFQGKNIIGDRTSGALYQIDKGTFDEAGNHLVKKVITPIQHAFPSRFSVDALHLDMAVGIGLNSTNDHEADPQVQVRASKDGGKTFGNARTHKLGKLGEFDQRRITISRFGQFYASGAAFEISCSSPVKFALLGGSMEITRDGP